MKAMWDEVKGRVRPSEIAVHLTGHGNAEPDWLPPFMEWDFRTIKERESRLACCWEYARNTAGICENLSAWIDGAGGATTLGNFICAEGMRFPEPWVLCSDELRCASELVEADESPVTVYSMKARKEFVIREVVEAQADGRDVREVLERLLLTDGYAVIVDFEGFGGHAAAKALAGWARDEAKKFPQMRRGKGATPPFEWLKWLAALRLETVRKEAGIRFGEVQAMLARHEREFPIAGASPTLPVYASHGAWSKAIGDARRGLELLGAEPLAFERRILL